MSNDKTADRAAYLADRAAYRSRRKQQADEAALRFRQRLDRVPSLIATAFDFGVSVPLLVAALRRLDKHDQDRLPGHPVSPLDSEVDRLVEWIGVARLRTALDRATHPKKRVTKPPLPLMAAE